VTRIPPTFRGPKALTGSAPGYGRDSSRWPSGARPWAAPCARCSLGLRPPDGPRARQRMRSNRYLLRKSSATAKYDHNLLTQAGETCEISRNASHPKHDAPRAAAIQRKQVHFSHVTTRQRERCRCRFWASARSARSTTSDSRRLRIHSDSALFLPSRDDARVAAEWPMCCSLRTPRCPMVVGSVIAIDGWWC
jgi:hypothetical protein